MYSTIVNTPNSTVMVHAGPGGGGGAAGGRKMDPVAMRSVHKKIHPVTIYLTKNFHNAYPVAILHRRWCPIAGLS